MQTVSCELLYRPQSTEHRFLPEGPYSLSNGRISWVAIQHGPQSTVGSVNVLDLSTRTNESFELAGRPGFAFPTDQDGTFVCGVERSLGLFNTATSAWTELASDIDGDVNNTIINDGVVYDDNLVFGCKDLEFKTRKAGLYLWRAADRQLIALREDQLCSNGKAVIERDGATWLIDIDSPDKQITYSRLNIADGTLTERSVIVDLTSENVFPDGMIMTPDHQSLIVAIYNPDDADAGEARQYSLQTGELQRRWLCPGAAQVTCPQLVKTSIGVQLVLTTAVEHLPAERLKTQPNAGSLFIGETEFNSIGDQPVFRVSQVVK